MSITAWRIATLLLCATFFVSCGGGGGGGGSSVRPIESDGIWTSVAELVALPTSGPGWDAMLDAANTTPSPPDLSNGDQSTNVITLAKALVYARTGDSAYRDEVIDLCMSAIDTELGGDSLALSRELGAYVISAELVGLPPEDDLVFRAWLRRTLTQNLQGRTLRSTHEDRPNNWGTHAGASRAAVAIYLNDAVELDRVATVFRGWLGDRSSYAGFTYGELSWQDNPVTPVGVNPVGAVKDGVSIDGALPDDMRRGGVFQDPPLESVYPWEAMQGAIVQAEILHRAGYDAWEWGGQALLRAADYLHSIGWETTGDDEWQPWLINARYGTNFPTGDSDSVGKNMGWTEWLFGS